MIAEVTTAADVWIKFLGVIENLFFFAFVVAAIAVFFGYSPWTRNCDCQEKDEEDQ